MNGFPARHEDQVRITEIWADNVALEFDRIKDVVEKFPYIAMDTEFPGIVARPIGVIGSLSEYNYQTVKFNVDALKVIQLGLTFADKSGAGPTGGGTWQFNFKFDIEQDMHAQDSIDFLKQSGVDFKRHQTAGIEPHVFGELIMSSGLVLNEYVRWIAFHGSYDFGYLLKLLTCEPLPDSEKSFFSQLTEFIPCLYDIKFLLRNVRNLPLNGGLSLQKVADHLNVRRVGPQHQAGSDSLVTCETFFKIMDAYFDNQVDDSLFAGVIYGLGQNGNGNAKPLSNIGEQISNGCHLRAQSPTMQACNMGQAQYQQHVLGALGLDGPSASGLLTNIEGPNMHPDGQLGISPHPHRRAQQPAQMHHHAVNHAHSLPPQHHQPPDQQSPYVSYPPSHSDGAARMARPSVSSGNGSLPPPQSPLSFYGPGHVGRDSGLMGPGLFGSRPIGRDFVPPAGGLIGSHVGNKGSNCQMGSDMLGSVMGPVAHKQRPVVQGGRMPGPGGRGPSLIAVIGPPRQPPPSATRLLSHTGQTPTAATCGGGMSIVGPQTPHQQPPQQLQQSSSPPRKAPQHQPITEPAQDMTVSAVNGGVNNGMAAAVGTFHVS